MHPILILFLLCGAVTCVVDFEDSPGNYTDEGLEKNQRFIDVIAIAVHIKGIKHQHRIFNQRLEQLEKTTVENLSQLKEAFDEHSGSSEQKFVEIFKALESRPNLKTTEIQELRLVTQDDLRKAREEIQGIRRALAENLDKLLDLTQTVERQRKF